MRMLGMINGFAKRGRVTVGVEMVGARESDRK